jgi:regulation of enolase protein 1 (concanavalin A-like superfamily)
VEWLNEPPAWEVRDETLIVTAGPKTDFWRTTHYGFVRDNGHLWVQSWEGRLRRRGQGDRQLSGPVRPGGTDGPPRRPVWLKCGVEFVDGVQQASAVVTREHSDWSVAPLKDNPRSIWLQVSRTGPDVEVRYSVDGERCDLLRLTRLTDAPQLLVGPMCAAPDGAGFEVAFEGFAIRSPGGH